MANTPTTNLTDIYTDGAWGEPARDISATGPIVDAEAYLQGSDCSSQALRQNKSGACGAMYLAVTDPAGFTDGTDIFLFWWYFLFPNALNPFNETQGLGQAFPTLNAPGTEAGYFLGVGSGDGNSYHWAVGGRDYGTYPYGGWTNVAIDPSTGATKAAIQEGTPTAGTYTALTATPNPRLGLNRGQGHAVDAVRWGRADIVFTGGSPAGTFDDMAAQNDLEANRWGIFQETAAGYLYKGKLELGTTATSLLFQDSNQSILIDDTRYCYPEFNLIEVNNANSNIIWENIVINKGIAYGSTIDSSRGNLIVNDDATTNLKGCSFTDMGFFNFGSNSTNTDVTFRRTDVVRQNGATFTNCDFEATHDSAHALHVSDSGNDISLITGCSFIATPNKSNHAIRLGDVAQTKTVNFSGNTLTDYTAGTTGDFVGTTGTDSAAIEVNVATSQTLTINVINNSSVPSIQNLGAGTVSIVQAATVSLTRLLGNTEISVLDNPSPYSATSLPAPSVTTVSSAERISADTFVGDNTNYYQINTGGTFVTIDAVGSAVFSNFPGVLQDTNATNPRALADGDKIRIVVRDDDTNPSLQLFDEFEVDADPTAPTTTSIITKTLSSGFTSAFGTAITGANSKTVTVEKVDARFQFGTPVGNVLDVLAFRTGSDPVLTLNIVAETGNIPLTQVGDRNYSNPA
jgi:hypothetical protein